MFKYSGVVRCFYSFRLDFSLSLHFSLSLCIFVSRSVICVIFRGIVESQKCVCSISEMLANIVPIFMRLCMRRTWQMVLPAKLWVWTRKRGRRRRQQAIQRESQNALNPMRDVRFICLLSLLLLLLLAAVRSVCVHLNCEFTLAIVGWLVFWYEILFLTSLWLTRPHCSSAHSSTMTQTASTNPHRNLSLSRPRTRWPIIQHMHRWEEHKNRASIA